VIAPLDAGGQGLVYRGLHPTLGRDVVIKLSRAAGGPADRDRLQEEGRILADLEHPNLARVYDLDVHDGRAFLVMEYVRGPHLEQFARQRPPSPRQAAALVAPVAQALAAAHRRGVVHRDVKPKNILIDEAGRPRLIDFGLARLEDAWHQAPSEEGEVAGTLAYMPPEQARDAAEVGPRSDVFSLGGVLYFLLTGKPLYGV
jgi:serine/threonine protein kinase